MVLVGAAATLGCCLVKRVDNSGIKANASSDWSSKDIDALQPCVQAWHGHDGLLSPLGSARLAHAMATSYNEEASVFEDARQFVITLQQP